MIFVPDIEIVAVNSRKYSNDVIHDAIKYTMNKFIVANSEFYSIVSVDYHDGERDTTKPDLLRSVIAPLAK